MYCNLIVLSCVDDIIHIEHISAVISMGQNFFKNKLSV